MEIINTIYSMAFDELNDAQKGQAYDVMRSINEQDTTPYWSVMQCDDMKETLKEYGIDDADIQWSGFSCQGDGASISTDTIDIEKFLRKVKAWSKFKSLHRLIDENDVSASVLRDTSRYCHEYCVTGNVEAYYNVDITKRQEWAITELQTFITEFIRDKSRDLYRTLEAENDYQDTDNAIKEHIEANEYSFKVDSDGKVLELA